MIYLDNNATTRVAPEVLDAMQPYLGQFFGNPSSAHALGREMKRAVEQSREQVANLIGADDTNEIVFTSCGSESDNWAIRGVLATQPIRNTSSRRLVEHEAVRNLCRLLESEGYEVTWLGVDHNGELDLEVCARHFDPIQRSFRSCLPTTKPVCCFRSRRSDVIRAREVLRHCFMSMVCRQLARSRSI
jgi:cysteine desulfurase